MPDNDTAEKVESLANDVIGQAIFISNLCDKFKHVESHSHQMKIAQDIGYHISRLSEYQDFEKQVNELYQNNYRD